MADLQITGLQALPEASVQANDVLALADLSASETKKITVKNLIAAGVALIDNGDIPSGKLGSGYTGGTVADGSITNAKVESSSSATTGLDGSSKIRDGSIPVIKFNISDVNSWAAKPTLGSQIEQLNSNGNVAKGYVASYDENTAVLKYYQDRSLYFGNNVDQTDYVGVNTNSNVVAFSGDKSIKFDGGVPVDTSPAIAFTGRTMSDGNNEIDLGVYFTGGFANSEINKKTGDVIYIDNRKSVTRDIRQKEDIKIILEF